MVLMWQRHRQYLQRHWEEPQLEPAEIVDVVVGFGLRHWLEG
jgi:hypothetical protein